MSVLDDIVARQAGVLTREQALAWGMTRGAIRGQLAAGRWQRLRRGIYATFTGPPPRRSVLWAAVLKAGRGAMLSHETAAELIGLCEPVPAIHVTVPSHRRISDLPGVVTHYREAAERQLHPTRTPPQTRVEETVLDLAQSAVTIERAVGWLAAACGNRVTTVPRLLAALALRKKVRWRTELTAALADVAEGCHSVLERRYLRDVERAHGLPRGCRQAKRRTSSGRRYDDVRYARQRVVVELDGRAAHPGDRRWRDHRRDNESTVGGDRVLRYGWGDLAEDPCAVAEQVAAALRAGGWRGYARPCRSCRAAAHPPPEAAPRSGMPR